MADDGSGNNNNNNNSLIDEDELIIKEELDADCFEEVDRIDGFEEVDRIGEIEKEVRKIDDLKFYLCLQVLCFRMNKGMLSFLNARRRLKLMIILKPATTTTKTL